jgi:methylated-DNA-[protein]-cysteine S-methyltransferase
MTIQSHDKRESSFATQCYALLKEIPEGRITSYKEIANALNTKAYRAVGSAMAKNKDLITIPCHRVVKSDARVGEYALGTEAKIALLEKEGVKIIDKKVQDFDTLLFRFDT